MSGEKLDQKRMKPWDAWKLDVHPSQIFPFPIVRPVANALVSIQVGLHAGKGSIHAQTGFGHYLRHHTQ